MQIQVQRSQASAVVDRPAHAPKRQETPRGKPAGEAAPPREARMVSVDVLRGVDMFLIIGADDVVRALASNSHNRWMQMLGAQFEHVPWDGCHLYDLIFPVFLFTIGASMPF